MPSFFASCGKYAEYFRISFLNILAYRARYYIGIVTYLIYIAVYYAIWRAVYAHSASGIDGFNLQEMVTYVAVGWVVRSFMFNNLDREVEQKVIDGSLSLDLLKPVDFQGMQFSRAFGEGLFRLVLFAFPTALVAFPLFDVSMPASGAHAAAFAASALLGAFIMTSVNFIVGSLAIPLHNIEGIAYAKQNLIIFLSGLLLPFDMLPAGLAAVLKVLPFAGISYLPLKIYLGQYTGTEIWQALALQTFWAVALLAGSRVLFSFFMRKVVIQGG